MKDTLWYIGVWGYCGWYIGVLCVVVLYIGVWG